MAVDPTETDAAGTRFRGERQLGAVPTRVHLIATARPITRRAQEGDQQAPHPRGLTLDLLRFVEPDSNQDGPIVSQQLKTKDPIRHMTSLDGIAGMR